jgi:hypothetical protein
MYFNSDHEFPPRPDDGETLLWTGHTIRAQLSAPMNPSLAHASDGFCFLGFQYQLSFPVSRANGMARI